MRILLLGAPGAGKGTQAQCIKKKYNIPHISTGDILRAALRAETPLGKLAKEIMEAGKLVPDEIMIPLVKERLSEPDCINGFLLDGFPRTIAQAEALQAIAPMDIVIKIDVKDEALVQRLSGRFVHPASGRIYHAVFNPPKEQWKDDETGEPLIQRDDDKEATVRKRLAVYHEQTKPLVEYFSTRSNMGASPKYYTVSGAQPVEAVTEQILKILGS